MSEEARRVAVPVRPVDDPLVPEPGELLLHFHVKRVLFSRGDFRVLLGRAIGPSRKDGNFVNLDDFTVAGSLDPAPEVGLDYRLVGRFDIYRGRRSFRARLGMPIMARTAKGIASWLRRQDIDGLGETRIVRIAKAAAAHGEDALADPEFLASLGLKPPLVERISALWVLSGVEARVKAMLFAFGVRGATVKRVWEAHGSGALDIAREHPWEFCVAGFIGFDLCDRMAARHGLPMDHPARRRAAVLEALRRASLEGHTALIERDLLLRAAKLLDQAPEDLAGVLATLVESGRLVRLEGGLLQTSERHRQERRLASFLMSDVRRAVFGGIDEARRALERAEERLGVRLDRDGGQFEAALMVLTSPVSVLTGGPGTGKTTTQRVVVEALREAGRTPLLLSPTGRAAKRLGEATGARAHTIAKIHHMSRGMTVKVPSPGGGEDKAPDIAIVDEASMLCLDGASQLASFLPEESALVFVGDVDQLPSVGPGALLRDMIDGGIFPVRWLERIHRQAGGSDIPFASRMILAGEPPSSGRDVIVRDVQDGALIDSLRAEVGRLLAHGCAPEDIQVLAPMKRGPLGTYALNEVLRPLLNPDAAGGGRECRIIAGFRFALDDRVMNVRNDYARGVMNGEIGVVREFVDVEDDTRIVVEFDGEFVTYSAQEDDLDHAFPLVPCYATTVHKAQGCEFPAVVFLLPRAHSVLASRNLIYTALTRARAACVILGPAGTLASGCRSTRMVERVTHLAQSLRMAAETKPGEEPVRRASTRIL